MGEHEANKHRIRFGDILVVVEKDENSVRIEVYREMPEVEPKVIGGGMWFYD